MLRDAFTRDDSEWESLAKLVKRKTQGNPFFINTFISTLYAEGLLNFDHQNNVWACDISTIKSQDITDNVVDLLVKKMNKLPSGTQYALSIASLLGNEFELGFVSLFFDSNVLRTLQLLLPAIEENFLLALDEEFDLLVNETTDIKQKITFRFLHDRVQQAAQSMLSKDEVPSLYYRTAKLLLSNYSQSELDDAKLFLIVGSFNKGLIMAETREQKIEIATLNCRAAIQAKGSTAYESCKNFVEIGEQILEAYKDDEDVRELLFNLKKLETECTFLLGNIEKAERLYPECLRLARTVSDKISVYFIMRDHYELQGKYNSSVKVMCDGLALYDIVIPNADEDELTESLHREYALVGKSFENRTVDELVNAPQATEGIEILRLFWGLWCPLYLVAKQNLTAFVSCMMAKFVLLHGNSVYSSIAFCSYACYTGWLSGDFKLAQTVATAGITLSEKYPNLNMRCKSYFLYGCLNMYNGPLRASNFYNDQGYELGVQTGDLVTAAYSTAFIITDRFYQGVELEEVLRVYKQYLPFLKSCHTDMYNYVLAVMLPFRQLLGLSENDWDEAKYLKTYENMPLFQSIYYTGKAISCFFFKERDNWITVAEQAFLLVPKYLTGTYKVSEAQFFAAMIYFDAYQSLTQEEQKRADEVIGKITATFKTLSECCTANFEHKLLLLEAEKASIQGDTLQAMDLYEAAIASAHESEFIQFEAIACEQYAKFWLCQKKPKEKFARVYLQEALYLYQRWGAKCKIEFINLAYGNYLQPLPTSPKFEMDVFNFSDESASCLEKLELLSVIKVAQEISACSETDLNKRLYVILKIIMDQSGAHRIAFFYGSDRLYLKAEGSVSDSSFQVRSTVDLDSWSSGPKSVINFVKRTQKSVLLGNAMLDSQFGADLYVSTSQAKSILAMPLMLNSAFKGVLYLDNNLRFHAFTRKTVEMVEILAVQMAISVELMTSSPTLNRLEGDVRLDHNTTTPIIVDVLPKNNGTRKRKEHSPGGAPPPRKHYIRDASEE
eukprot:TRINITY_DN2720_c0_g1_i2.p1 TRINITY_DN2720_c0_g1~~TRINITY_DN2720_c0_g1_i2.p1  ORF type:complete len:1009 (-),score=151.33 TRINITY_DN2720_c0_g1_i2:171-3197(-)